MVIVVRDAGDFRAVNLRLFLAIVNKRDHFQDFLYRDVNFCSVRRTISVRQPIKEKTQSFLYI